MKLWAGLRNVDTQVILGVSLPCYRTVGPMEKLLFHVDPRSIGVMVESDEGDGEETYLPVLMFNYKITG